MIGRRGKLLILVYVVFLTILFLMCSTDLIIREPEKDIYQIAVIIEDSRDDNYGNFRKGMEQAAMEFQADVHFITLYETMDADQQMELIRREQQDGADALIVVPADEDRVISALAGGRLAVPVVLLGSGLTGEGTAGIVWTDYRMMGEKLAREMIEDTDENCLVRIFEDPGKRSVMSRLFLEGAKAEFERSGRGFESIVWEGQGPGVANPFEASVVSEAGQTAILAENPEILTEAALALARTADTPEAPPAAEGCIWGLYGRGDTLPILNYMDRGVIKGLCVTDQFSMGYLSVSTAVQVLEGGMGRKRIELDSWYVERDDLRRPEYEKLLYPVE